MDPRIVNNRDLQLWICNIVDRLKTWKFLNHGGISAIAFQNLNTDPTMGSPTA